MHRRRDEAFVLDTRELGDADLIVRLFAREHGIVRGVAPRARASRRRFGGYLEPLTRIRVDWTIKPGRDLHRIDGVEGVRSFATMQADPERQAACAVLAEILGVVVQEEHPEPEIFRLVDAVLQALEGGADPWALLRYFEFWVLRLQGVLVDLEGCCECGRRLGSGASAGVSPGRGLVCDDCAVGGEATVRRAGRTFLAALRRVAPAAVPDAGEDRGGGGVEGLLRGSLESYVERRFRSYRHFRAAQRFRDDLRGTK